MSTTSPESSWYRIGPHGYFDLVRLARRGRNTIVRVLYVVALLVVLAVAHRDSMPQTTMGSLKRIGISSGPTPAEVNNLNARIGERFCITILVMQNLAVLVLTPIYMAASIQEERDRQTFSLLFTTHLTPREIVLGKWLSRSAHIGGIVIAGLPVLSFVQLWGGIDMPMIAANFTNTACLILLLAALSLSIAVRTNSIFRGIARTFLLLVGVLFCIGIPTEATTSGTILLVSPYWGNAVNYQILGVKLFVMMFLQLSLTLFFLWRATRDLEALRTAEPPPTEKADDPNFEPEHNRFYRWPAIGDAPIAWKERYLDRSIWILLPIFLFPYALIIFCAYLSVWVTFRHRLHDVKAMNDLELILEMIMLGSLALYALGVSLRMAGCIVRERQRHTLDSIATLPLSTESLLRQKFIGNLLRYRLWLPAVGFPALVLLIFVPRFWQVLVLLPIVFGVHLAFFANLGLYLSIVCRRAVTAFMAFGIVAFLICGGLPIAVYYLNLSSRFEDLLRGLHPAYAWFTVTETWWHQQQSIALYEVLAGTLLYAAAALALWRISCRRFARDPS
jgi:ABC-type transport system involved in multi-copper enzyme maturation permease subunit